MNRPNPATAHQMAFRIDEVELLRFSWRNDELLFTVTVSLQDAQCRSRDAPDPLGCDEPLVTDEVSQFFAFEREDSPSDVVWTETFGLHWSDRETKRLAMMVQLWGASSTRDIAVEGFGFLASEKPRHFRHAEGGGPERGVSMHYWCPSFESIERMADMVTGRSVHPIGAVGRHCVNGTA